MGFADRGNSGGVIVRAKYRRADNDGICTGFDRPCGVFPILPPVNLDDRVEATLVTELT
jgi:hypothetical protein